MCVEDHEWQAGDLPAALHIPRGRLESSVRAAIPKLTTRSSATRLATGRPGHRQLCSRARLQEREVARGGHPGVERRRAPDRSSG